MPSRSWLRQNTLSCRAQSNTPKHPCHSRFRPLTRWRSRAVALPEGSRFSRVAAQPQDVSKKISCWQAWQEGLHNKVLTAMRCEKSGFLG
jgi:hypothetical protein